MEHFVKTLMNAQVNLAWPTQIVSIEKVSMNVLTFTGFPRTEGTKSLISLAKQVTAVISHLE